MSLNSPAFVSSSNHPWQWQINGRSWACCEIHAKCQCLKNANFSFIFNPGEIYSLLLTDFFFQLPNPNTCKVSVTKDKTKSPATISGGTIFVTVLNCILYVPEHSQVCCWKWNYWLIWPNLKVCTWSHSGGGIWRGLANLSKFQIQLSGQLILWMVCVA